MPLVEHDHRVLPANFAGFAFEHSYSQLPERFFSRLRPTPVAAPSLIAVNHSLAYELGLDPAVLETEGGIALLAGNALPADASPLAQAYAGHQFGYFNPQLGDGRAILLGEVKDSAGHLRDVQWKGSGPTPYSRRGDGRAAVGPVVREYILSEAMHALGIPTTRSLAAVTTGERVYREVPLPGAILTRVAASHVRIGTFEYFRGKEDKEAVRILADFVIERHYPELRGADNPYSALLNAVVNAQAALIAQWMQVGFIHGVMNTDNMAISGETIDYGPCAFMNAYDPATVYSSIDTHGRYAFGNQPSIAIWNLTRFAECLLHLFDQNSDKAVAKAEESLANFSSVFASAWYGGMWRKLGLTQQEEGDEKLLGDFLKLMQENGADYTLAFRLLADVAAAREESGPGSAQRELEAMFPKSSPELGQWLGRWLSRLAGGPDIPAIMYGANPLYVPRNHRIEATIQAAVQDNYEPMHEMLSVLRRPYQEQPGRESYAEPPAPGEDIEATFCGT